VFCIVHLNIFAADKVLIVFNTLTLYGANTLGSVCFIFSGLAFLPAAGFYILIVFEPINNGGTPDA
jgi:hypothetical protein